MSGAPRQLCPSCGTLPGHATLIARAGSQARSVARHRDLRTQHAARHRDRQRQIRCWTGSPRAGGSAASIHDRPAVRQTVWRYVAARRHLHARPLSPPIVAAERRGADECRNISEPFLLAYPKTASRKGGPAWGALGAEQRLLREKGHCLREQTLVDCSPRHQPGNPENTCRCGRGLYARACLGCIRALYSRLPGSTFARQVGLAWRKSNPRATELLALSDKLRQIARSLDGVKAI